MIPRCAIVDIPYSCKAGHLGHVTNHVDQLLHSSVAKLVVIEYTSEDVHVDVFVVLFRNVFALHLDLGGVDPVDVYVKVTDGCVGQLDGPWLAIRRSKATPALRACGPEESGFCADRIFVNNELLFILADEDGYGAVVVVAKLCVSLGRLRGSFDWYTHTMCFAGGASFAAFAVSSSSSSSRLRLL